jgi:hypothetical protein
MSCWILAPFEAHEGKKGSGLLDVLDRMFRSIDVFVQQGGQAHHDLNTQASHKSRRSTKIHHNHVFFLLISWRVCTFRTCSSRVVP